MQKAKIKRIAVLGQPCEKNVQKCSKDPISTEKSWA
jgi:hypothetical protein